jgi:hypothetical protein
MSMAKNDVFQERADRKQILTNNIAKKEQKQTI